MEFGARRHEVASFGPSRGVVLIRVTLALAANGSQGPPQGQP